MTGFSTLRCSAEPRHVTGYYKLVWMQMPQIMMDCQYALHDTSSISLTQSSRKALCYAGSSGGSVRYWRDVSAPSENDTVDTFRILARYQDDISASDLSWATMYYEGPSEAVDVLIAHSSLHFERFDTAESVGSEPPLAVALRCYSRAFCFQSHPIKDNSSRVLPVAHLPERKKWEPLIKRFIHKETDLHLLVPRDPDSLSFNFPFHVSEYITLLDPLFLFSETPDEARTLGAEWLRMLGSQGHNVVAYLEKEMTIRPPKHKMTCPATYFPVEVPTALRELQFTFDDAGPCVWWDWWIDPASDIDLLEREFKQMVKLTDALVTYMNPFLIDTWPYQYPIWYDNPEKLAQDFLDHYMNPAERRRRAHLAMQRANRRLEKRYAKNTYSKALRRSRIPGAWPGSSWECRSV